MLLMIKCDLIIPTIKLDVKYRIKTILWITENEQILSFEGGAGLPANA